MGIYIPYLDESMGALFLEHGLVHRNLHGGNILVENEMDSINVKITDTGLHGPVDKQICSKQIYGVIPFVSPEIFNGYTLTKESNIYSFGMIMWMLSAGVHLIVTDLMIHNLYKRAFARLLLQCFIQ
ncbi:unnamed protein product [Rhizophagus irregularis]|nr:unnamed protein product [Rhizophagus irregularis]